MGWLSAIPKGSTEARFEIYGTDLPELPATERLHEVWHDLGRHSGQGPISWAEISAYIDLTGADLSRVEIRTLRLMSQAYVDGLMDTGPLSISPMERAAADG